MSSRGQGHLFGGGLPSVPEAETLRVELDKKALFALASDTRVEILQTLEPMRRTVTQLAEELGIDKAAVHRHLQKLVEGGLVKRYEDHGFVYYGLAWKTRDLLNPTENTKIIILLTSAFLLLAVAGAFVIAGLSYVPGITQGVDFPVLPGVRETDLLSDGGTTGEGPVLAPSMWPWPLAATLSAVAAVPMILIARRFLRGPKQKEISGSVSPQ